MHEQGGLPGPVAVAMATIAVAAVGFMLLGGRVSYRDGVRVVIGRGWGRGLGLGDDAQPRPHDPGAERRGRSEARPFSSASRATRDGASCHASEARNRRNLVECQCVSEADMFQPVKVRSK